MNQQRRELDGKMAVFWGGTGHAKVLRELIEHLGYRLCAVFDNNASVLPPFADIPIYYGISGFHGWKQETEPQNLSCFVTIGGARGHDRLQIQEMLENEGLRPAAVIHPTAFVAENAVLSKGCQILAHAAVCAEVSMGAGCILNTSCSVDHECNLGNGVHIGPGAVLAGIVTVGDCTFIGTGAIVLPRVTIGANTIIGAGAVVTRDIQSGVVAYGNPARVMKTNCPEI